MEEHQFSYAREELDALRARPYEVVGCCRLWSTDRVVFLGFPSNILNDVPVALKARLSAMMVSGYDFRIPDIVVLASLKT